jgi:hypothetical protein
MKKTKKSKVVRTRTVRRKQQDVIADAVTERIKNVFASQILGSTIYFTMSDQRCNGAGISARFPGSTFTGRKVLTLHKLGANGDVVVQQFPPHEIETLIKYLIGQGSFMARPRTTAEVKAAVDAYTADHERFNEERRRIEQLGRTF